MTILRCNDPRCRGNSCIVATIEGGHLLITSKHHGEKHVARIDISALATTVAPLSMVQSA